MNIFEGPQQKLEYLCGLAQRAKSEAVIVSTDDLAETLSKLNRIMARNQKAEQKLLELRKSK